MVWIVDSGLGNIGSIRSMLIYLGWEVSISRNVGEIEKADKLILPGVGSFDYGMDQINTLGLSDILHYKATEQKVPVLGICLGMQLMGKDSEEGQKKGLGWLDHHYKFFGSQPGFSQKVPNIGWKKIKIVNPNSLLLKGLPDDPRFYFVHSYYCEPENFTDVAATSLYDFEYPCIIERNNIFGTQFHPEKSHVFGMTLLDNFMKL